MKKTAKRRIRPFLLMAGVIGFVLPAAAQEQGAASATVVVEPAALTLAVGEKATLKATVRDAEGMVVDRPVIFFSRARRSVSVDSTSGEVTALRPGNYVILARVPMTPDAGRRGPSAAETRSP